MPQSYIKRILDARVYDVARETPVDQAALMSRRLDNRVWLKAGRPAARVLVQAARRL